MIRIGLTEDQRSELRQVKRQAVGRVAVRAHMGLLSDHGYSVPRIADIHDCGEDVVRVWLRRYEERGVEGLEDEPKSGRPRKDPLAPAIVETQMSQSPPCSGHVHSCWSVGRLSVFLGERFHLSLSPSTVRRYLQDAGWRWRRAKLAPASVLPNKKDPQADEKRARIATALALATLGAAHLLHLDECDLHLLPIVRSMWMKGPRVAVPTPGKNAKRGFFGARNAISDAWHFVDHDRKLAVHFVGFLDALAQAYPVGRLFLVLDNAPIHTAKVVQKWIARNPRVELLWLPKYTAHQENPVERVWGLMKDAVAANRLYGSIDELTEAARRFFRDELVLPKARTAESGLASPAAAPQASNLLLAA
jgi:transposase